MKKFYCFVLAALLPLMGCSSVREIKDLAPHLTGPDASLAYHKTINAALKHYFTPEAYRVIKDIPVIDGPAFNAYVSGVNFWSNLASFITFNGIGRKVIIPTETLSGEWGIYCLIHEYVHHLDDMDRDGLGEWIDHDEFARAYKLMANDMKWAGIVKWTEERANDFITDVFGIGYASEHIAYVAQQLAKIGGPDYMRYVYRHMLNFNYQKQTTVTTTKGQKILITLD